MCASVCSTLCVTYTVKQSPGTPTDNHVAFILRPAGPSHNPSLTLFFGAALWSAWHLPQCNSHMLAKG